ncbi:hypothetical protein [Streptomyces sp. KLOTTS4A1]|uniref:DUF7848 domain-containing protein n=1 Tax=Streptomyces sp. KLOTTS4A1 TaxID=3390996 RepID=UPI0039F49383
MQTRRTVTPTVLRHPSWTIAADRTRGASAPLRHVECTTCGDESPTVAVTEQAATDSWAVRHAGAVGHTGFREVVTAYLRATAAPGKKGASWKRA